MNTSSTWQVLEYIGLPFLLGLVLIWLAAMYLTRKEAVRYPVAVSLGNAAMFIVLGYLFTLSANVQLSVLLAYFAVIPLGLAALLTLAWFITYLSNVIRGGMNLKAHLAQVLPIVLMIVGLFHLGDL